MSVIKAEKHKDGTIIHTTDDGDKIRYRELRGGLSWAGVSPTDSAPHYFCIAGYEWTPEAVYDGEQREKGVIRLVSEYESTGLMGETDFFRRLTDDAKRFCCTGFYADIREVEGERNPNQEALEQYLRDNQIEPRISLRQAPYVDDFLFGLHRINALREQKLIDIENSKALEQLKVVQRPDLTESPEIRYYAINGLRHAVVSYFKSPPSYIPSDWGPTRRYVPNNVPGRSIF